MISIRMSLTASLVFLFISRVVAQNGWSVTYNPTSVCVLKGDTVIIDCIYTYPSNHSVLKAFWTKERVTSGSEPRDLLADPEYRDRLEYLGDKQRDCSFTLRDVREKDQTKYYFTFITDQPGGRYQGVGGVGLSVTGLQVEVSKTEIGKDSITLTCKTSCRLTDIPTFTWYKDRQKLSSSTDQLHLLVSSEDSGSYHCSILDVNLHSLVVTPNDKSYAGLITGIAVTCVLIFVLSVGFCVWKKIFPDACRGATPDPDPSRLEQCSPESQKFQESGEACSDNL